jgi:hypothetical protein
MRAALESDRSSRNYAALLGLSVSRALALFQRFRASALCRAALLIHEQKEIHPPKTPARNDCFAQSFRFTPEQAANMEEAKRSGNCGPRAQ